MVLRFLVGTLVYLVTHCIGALGFSQIIGCIQNIATMKTKIIFPVILWAGILVGSYFVMNRFVPEYSTWYYAAAIISFIQVMLSGKIH